RDLPPVARSTQHVVVWHDHAVEEELRELSVAGDLLHRTYLEPGRLHVDDEQRDPLVLRGVRIGARQDAAPARELAPRDPRLLSADEVPGRGLDGGRAERREIG